MTEQLMHEVLGRVALVKDDAVLRKIVEVLDEYVTEQYGEARKKWLERRDHPSFTRVEGWR